MWIDLVKIDGAAVPLDEVIADVVIRHGRRDPNDAPTASTLQLTLLGVDRLYSAPFRVGVPVSIRADGESRFVGTVTDASLEDDALTVIGVGPLSTLHRYPVGAAPWPSEKWSLRVQRVFAEAGLSAMLVLQADLAFDPVLLERGTELEPPDAIALDSYLSELAEDVGAAVADTPDGRILVQQLTSRASGVATWDALPDSLSWQEVDAEVSWEEATTLEALGLPPALPALTIPPENVVYVPPWIQTLELVNEVTVGYGDNEKVTVEDATSRALYGPYPSTISTQIATLADATTRADERLSRMAYPRWRLPDAPIIGGVPLTIGQVINLSGFPPPSPSEAVQAVLEGWTDSIVGDDWTVDIALSDPIYSGLSLSWEDVSTELAWNEVDPDCRWIDATTTDALTEV